MFNEGYLSISFEALLGLTVTIVSVWLVVKQLRKTNLASQMEGLQGWQRIFIERAYYADSLSLVSSIERLVFKKAIE